MVLYEANTELQTHSELLDEWVSLKGVLLLAGFCQERAMIDYTKTIQDGEGHFVHSTAEWKEMSQACARQG
jgi:hypothetical protein